MLSFSAVESDCMPPGSTTSIETNVMLAWAFFTMIYYAVSVVIDSDCFDPWRRNDRIRRHRLRSRRNRRRRRHRDCSSRCPNVRTSSCLPAPLPTPTRQHQGSTLKDLVRIQAWESVIQRCATREGRREAKLRDIDGLLPLHWACSGGPTTDAIRSLIKAYPKAARKRDYEGSTPLHFACHYGIRSIEVLRLLIDACPAAIHRRDTYGRSPLFHAVDKRASAEVLTLLLQADPSTALLPLVPASIRRSRTNAKPELTFRSMRHTANVKKHPKTNESYGSSSSSTPNTPLELVWKQATYMNAHKRGRGKNTAGWNKAVLLLKAAYHHISLEKQAQQQDEIAKNPYGMSIDLSVTNVLHAALALNAHIPRDIVSFILHKHPEQALVRDQFGNLPLTLALSTPFCRHLSRRDIISRLLHINPTAARSPSADGKLPLTIAIENGLAWDEGIEQLIKTHPEALYTVDKGKKLGLYPFMVAACAPIPPAETNAFVSEPHDEAKRVENIYKLLRNAPDLATQSTEV